MDVCVPWVFYYAMCVVYWVVFVVLLYSEIVSQIDRQGSKNEKGERDWKPGLSWEGDRRSLRGRRIMALSIVLDPL